MAASSSALVFSNLGKANLPTLSSKFPPSNHHSFIFSAYRQKKRVKLLMPRIRAMVSTTEKVRSSPDDLVTSILAKVKETDRGVSLTKEGHKEVAEVAQQLAKFCVDEPVKNPLIFGEWDVVYCSVPTKPGGGYRSTIGRLVFKTNEMMQVVKAPDAVDNKVSFSVFGFLDGEVSLKGKLKILDDKWIQVIFEPPQLKVGALDFTYGGESEVKLEITYIDERIRLGRGSQGSLFVFKRRS